METVIHLGQYSGLGLFWFFKYFFTGLSLKNHKNGHFFYLEIFLFAFKPEIKFKLISKSLTRLVWDFDFRGTLEFTICYHCLNDWFYENFFAETSLTLNSSCIAEIVFSKRIIFFSTIAKSPWNSWVHIKQSIIANLSTENQSCQVCFAAKIYKNFFQLFEFQNIRSTF